MGGYADEQRYHLLFQHMPICIFVVDLKATPAAIQEVNRRAELVYGYRAPELMGMPVTHLVPAEAEPAVLAIVEQVRQGHTVMTEVISQHRDGTLFPVRVIATLDPTDDRQMIVTVEDIGAEKQRRSETEAIEAERRRIAREIHDGVAQSLAGLRFKSALWSHRAHSAPPDMSAAVNELLMVLTESIADLRRAIFALRPLDLELRGFFPALTQLVGDFGDHNHLLASLVISGEPDALPAAYELPLFRIVQEGLNNVGQHAGASWVLVRLATNTGDGVIVWVRDNGRGFDPSQLGPVDREGHFGLRQMRERIVDLGGTLDIHSAPGQGTELVITLPRLPKETNDAAH